MDLGPVTEEYLSDEAAVPGQADAAGFPCTLAQVAEFMRQAARTPVTVQGARTGLCLGAAPRGGLALNLSRFNRVSRAAYENENLNLTVEAGMTLAALQELLQKGGGENIAEEAGPALAAYASGKQKCFFPPNPTETSATLGGIVACNSAGGHMLAYGGLGNFVRELTVVLGNGEVIKARPGSAEDRLKAGFHPLGLHDAALYIGSEGALGIIAEISLSFSPLPPQRHSLLCSFKDDGQMRSFQEALRQSRVMPRLMTLDYLDRESVDLVMAKKAEISSLRAAPDLDSAACACFLFLELAGPDEKRSLEDLELILQLLEEAGADSEQVLAAGGEAERQRLEVLRHGVVKTANLAHTAIYRARHTLPPFFDLLVNPGQAGETLAWLRSLLPCPGAIFGHMGAGHIHLHLFPENEAQDQAAQGFASRLAVFMGEKGIMPAAAFAAGARRRALLEDTLDDYKKMLRIKQELDPRHLMNRGCLFASPI
ncbi:MAG: FAD-binding oxidoreductase [Desulfarculales bacterium]|jgi:D-lactate dehydrogenase (cytochrome)|nr:FAD-binding oxidoreductase [Desulfarculales bacterium]